MEVESAQVPGDVYHFAYEIKSGNYFRFHSFRVEFVRVDAAGGDFRFGEAFGAGRRDLPVVGEMLESS